MLVFRREVHYVDCRNTGKYKRLRKNPFQTEISKTLNSETIDLSLNVSGQEKTRAKMAEKLPAYNWGFDS